jgi:hypothetical protein
MAKSGRGRASLKRAIKAALFELLDEHRDALQDDLAEAVEEVALLEAIRQGQTSRLVRRVTVTRALLR